MSKTLPRTSAARTASRYAAIALGMVGVAGIALALSLYVWDRNERTGRTFIVSYHLRSSSIVSRLADDIVAARNGLDEWEASRNAGDASPSSLPRALAAAHVQIQQLVDIQQENGGPEAGRILTAVEDRFDRFVALVDEAVQARAVPDLETQRIGLDSLALAVEQLRRSHVLSQTEHLDAVERISARRDLSVAVISGLFAAAVVAVGLRTLALLMRAFAREEELRASLERARRDQERGIKMEALGRLAGGVAHDFNNLLTVMLVNAEHISAEVDDDSELQWETESILRAISQAAALTRQLLTFSRSEDAGAPRSIDLNQLIRDMEILLSRLLGSHCTLVTHLSPDLDSVRVDPREIERVLLNLVSNASDAMPNGGTVKIETGNARRTRPEYSPRSADDGHPQTDMRDFVRLSVLDTGTGMNEETVERVFEPFFTTKGEDRGTGLGLATVHGMVAHAGGWIEVDSRVEIGTRVDVYLARCAEDPDEASDDTALEDSDSRHAYETILLVEDEPEIRRSSASALRRAGYTVLESADGPDALAQCKSFSERIDLIITDVRMPGMTGPELVEHTKLVRPEARVLFISGYTGADLPLGGRLLAKPFRSGELLDEVRSILSVRA